MPLVGVRRIELNGKEWYSEASLVKAFKTSSVKALRAMFGNTFTYFALSPKQRDDLVIQGIVPKSIKSSVLVLCDDVDAYLERNVAGGPPQQKPQEPSVIQNDTLSSIGENQISEQLEEIPISSCIANEIQSSGDYVKSEPMDEHFHGACSCPSEESQQNFTEDPGIVHPIDSRKSLPCTPNQASIGNAKRGRFESPDVKEERRYICQSCPFFVEFPNEAVYLRHMDLAHLANPSQPRTNDRSSSPSTEAAAPSQNTEVYTCKTCSANFNSFRGLKLHQSVMRHLDTSLRCSHCLMVFPAQEALSDHIASAHAFSCLVCPSKLFSGMKLYEHVQRAHKNEAFCCNKCYKMFRSADGYALHVRKTCTVSSKSKTIANQSLAASNAAKEKSKYTCEFCMKGFGFSLTLLYHKRTVHPEQFASQQGATGHETSELTEEWTPLVVDLGEGKGQRFACRICGQLFTRKEVLRSHEFNHVDVRQFKCLVCSRSFASYKQLWQHKQKHNTLTCLHCKKCFSLPGSLERHVEMCHKNDRKEQFTDGKPPAEAIACDLCDRKFQSPWALAAHRRFHRNTEVETKLEDSVATAEPAERREFKCDQCGKLMQSAPHLKEHMDRHSGIKRHQCERCGKAFTYKSAYYAHKRLPCNPNAMKFRCGFCQDMFHSKRALFQHVIKSHPELKNTCWCCSDKFQTLALLEAHLRSAHPEQLPKDDTEINDIEGGEEGQIYLPPKQEIKHDSVMEAVAKNGPPPLYQY